MGYKQIDQDQQKKCKKYLVLQNCNTIFDLSNGAAADLREI